MVVKGVIIGKRISVGAALYGMSEGIQLFFPEHASAIGAFTVPFIFFVQVLIANTLGVTNAGPDK